MATTTPSPRPPRQASQPQPDRIVGLRFTAFCTVTCRVIWGLYKFIRGLYADYIGLSWSVWSYLSYIGSYADYIGLYWVI